MGKNYFGIMALLCLILGSALGATQIPVTVNAPQDGLLSLGVYDASGKLIRSLAYAKEVTAGAQAFTWDATNDLGLPVAPGTYQVRGVSFLAGPKIDYRMKVGLSGTPAYRTKDGMGDWGGNLGAPMDMCSNGTQIIGVFQCVEDNYNTGLQLMDPSTGKILSRYYSFFAWDVRFAGAMDAQNFYLAVADLGAKRLVIGKYNLNEPRGRILTDIPGGDQVAADGRWAGRWTTDVRGIAVANGRLYVPVLPTNTLYIVDTDSGKMLHSVTIPSPRGVTVRNGQVYLLSEKRLLRLDADGKVLGTVIAAGLDNPNDVTMDAAGNFYVSDGMHSIFLNAVAEGAQANQVKVFSPQGKLLRKIGIDGGRPANGRYTPKGMLNPRGICLGPNGTLWVAEYEEAFQRVSAWNAKSGQLQREFFNTRISSGQGQLSPDRTEMIFNYDVFADAPGIHAYKVDVAKGTWYPAWSYQQPYSTMAQGDVFRGFLHGGYPLSTTPSSGDDPRFGGGWPYLSFAGDMVKGTNNHTYILGGEGAIWLFDDKAHAPKLAALVYSHRAYKAEDGKRYIGDYDQGPNNWFAWSDLNGDGKMAMDECQLTVNQPLMGKTPRPFGMQLQPDLSIMMICPENQPDRTFKYAVRRLPAKSVLPSGVPVYDWADLQDVVMLQVPSFVGGDGWKGGNNAYVGGINVHDGVIDTYAEPWADARLRLPGVDGDGWWASRNWRQTPLRFDAKTGAQLGWLKLGRRAPGRAKPGEMYYPRMAGAVDHALFVPDTFSQMWVWTDTGLYLGKLYHEQWEGIYDPDSIFTELTNAYVYKINGKIYAATGDHGVSVHEVTLPTLTPVTGGTITLTAEQAQAATPWDPDGPAPTKKPSYMAQSIYDYQDKKAVRTITVNGVLDPAEWGNVPPITITRAEKPVAQVRAVWDQETLYLAYTVQDAVGLKNAGTELPNCPFVSGSYVDFCLGADWNTPNRENTLAGDVRVILAKITGAQPQDYQMAYWPLIVGRANPQTIKSPAATRTFDEIAPLAGLTFATQPTADGYTLEVSVPFKALNLDPFKSLTVGFDASVAFANAAGTLRVEAAHWAGMSEANVVDRPGSSALVPATWGALTFDRTPVRALPQQ